MRFLPMNIAGAFVLESMPIRDERGAFSRIYCRDQMETAGLPFTCMQLNLSSNPARGTLRGLHYQDPPCEEAKIVRAVRGCAFDVVLDLRKGSATYLEWAALVLDADQANGVFIPEGCAHGFLTLADHTDLIYQMSRLHVAGQSRGCRWNDPAFRIDWPEQPRIIGEADRTWPWFTN